MENNLFLSGSINNNQKIYDLELEENKNIEHKIISSGSFEKEKQNDIKKFKFKRIKGICRRF